MNDLDKLLLNFLEEDIGKGDVTSAILPDVEIEAYIICKEDAVVAGLEEASRLFELVKCRVEALVRDGNYVKANTNILEVRGNAKNVLSAERTALNILMRMSGIATLTRKYIDIVSSVNKRVSIAGTRKTVPGLRYLDKKAIRLANGYTHRYRLDEMVLIKDNHLAILGSIRNALNLVRTLYKYAYRVEVEVRSLEEAVEAIECGADIIMLDNLTPSDVNAIVEELKKRGLRDRVSIEVSGGINMSNIKDYAKADVDFISIGELTHSVKSIDMSLEVRSVYR